MNTPVHAWHFVKDDWTLRDGRKLVVGETIIHEGPLNLCRSGLHASEHVIDALSYAPGSIVCRVVMGGKILYDTDKLVATKRTVLWAINAAEILRAFARWCALQVIHLWDPPGIVRRWLETGDESILAAARDAVRDAVRAAARAAQNEKLTEMIEEAKHE